MSFDQYCSSDAGGPPSGRAPILIPLLLLAVTSLIIRAMDLDSAFQRVFWSPAAGWTLDDDPFVLFLYHYGTWPALLAAGIGLGLWITSRFVARVETAGRFGGFLALALALGPGLVVNAALKDHYGRPRPRDVVEFGGQATFQPLGEPSFGGHGKSFPSGHSAMGFFWFAPCIYLWQRYRRLALGFAAMALGHGALMSFARIAQGAHWLSDALWAGGVLYLTSWMLHTWLIPITYPSPRSVPIASNDTALPSPMQTN